ncbi:nuclear transport factor 2 family protein [Lichenicola cladoniae]|uniref:Nuclear transport factor 2 family protein n=1 Tax=Lichenicola cladoniae TaxID=1484109 RepID=A0A6M8HRB5_9PROT|nr:nuclear transport factor 2 family protein [Acetobacteraceae bacterium]QKE90994.1 nuclear transport factor 2 family protein [Lichenicola cladoniae]
MQAMFDRVPDFHVDPLSVVAEGNMVIVRGIWSGTDTDTSARISFRAFVGSRRSLYRTRALHGVGI